MDRMKKLGDMITGTIGKKKKGRAKQGKYKGIRKLLLKYS